MEIPPPPPQQQHFLLVTNPMQGHISPARRLATRLMASNPGARVTFSTAVSGHRRMFPSLAPRPRGRGRCGCSAHPLLRRLRRRVQPGRAWPARDVHGVHVPCALGPRRRPRARRPRGALLDPAGRRVRGVLPLLPRPRRGPRCVRERRRSRRHGQPNELPSIVAITSPEHWHYLVLDLLRDLFLSLDEHKPRVLVNTFDALEPDALRAVPEFEVAAVGPVVPANDAVPSSADLLHHQDAKATSTYMEWLDTKPARSVVYVSFGSILSLSKRQEEEMRHGLEATGRPFLWVARKDASDGGASLDEEATESGGWWWSGATRCVLSHRAVGCFVTHCGSNSTLESVASGVPMVAVPQWTDQPTVAWLVEARMGVGARARVDGEGVVERGELRRCVEAVMGNDGEASPAIWAQSDRWRELASEAVAPGGTSERNLRAFVSAAAASGA